MCSAFYEGVCTKVSFHEVEHLARLSKTPSISSQPCSSFGVCFPWDPLVCWPRHPPHVLLPKPHSRLRPWEILQQRKVYPGCGWLGYGFLCPSVIEQRSVSLRRQPPAYSRLQGIQGECSEHLMAIEGLENTKVVKCEPHVLLPGS